MVYFQEDIQRYSCPVVDKEMEKDCLGHYVLAVDYFNLEAQYNKLIEAQKKTDKPTINELQYLDYLKRLNEHFSSNYEMSLATQQELERLIEGK